MKGTGSTVTAILQARPVRRGGFRGVQLILMIFMWLVRSILSAALLKAFSWLTKPLLSQKYPSTFCFTEATELHASLLGVTSFHMHEQYGMAWTATCSYINIHTVITE